MISLYFDYHIYIYWVLLWPKFIIYCIPICFYAINRHIEGVNFDCLLIYHVILMIVCFILCYFDIYIEPTKFHCYIFVSHSIKFWMNIPQNFRGKGKVPCPKILNSMFVSYLQVEISIFDNVLRMTYLSITWIIDYTVSNTLDNSFII